MDLRRVQKFAEIVNFLKKPRVIFQEPIQEFRVEAKREPFTGAGEVKNVSGVKTSFAEAFSTYDKPYEYLRKLLSNDDLTRSELYKLFVKISYRILNKDGCEVSGGERSEFRLLEEIADAQNYEILLVDEPESSFDNLFLNSNVNQILKAISQTMPVVVVTHNSTVGASVGADYVLYTSKEPEQGKLVYRIYCGHPTDRQLVSADGKAISNHQIMMDSLEAGSATYESRRQGYEALKIDGNLGHFWNPAGNYAPIDKITKEDLLQLVTLILNEEDVEFDDYDENAIKNQAHQIVYKSVAQKLLGLKERKQEFIDESERLFLEEYEKYREK